MRQATRGRESSTALLAGPLRWARTATRALVFPGQDELAARIDRSSVDLEVLPLEQPEEGLLVTIEVHQDGRELGAVRLKGLGVIDPISLRVLLRAHQRGLPGVLRVRSNAALHLIY